MRGTISNSMAPRSRPFLSSLFEDSHEVIKLFDLVVNILAIHVFWLLFQHPGSSAIDGGTSEEAWNLVDDESMQSLCGLFSLN